ncbi:magnesium transporter NIPA-domain-containing protein [Globomyces pollinis-pini]|nr:magnesium transporter NIPA-domain-containing protein [Globomyces pollinis-pini]
MMLISTLLLIQQTIAIQLIVGSCKSDNDCTIYSQKAFNSENPDNYLIDGIRGYACKDNACSYIVGNGTYCNQPSDCSQYAMLRNAIQSNRTYLFPKGVTSTNIAAYMENICSPVHCAEESSCQISSDPFIQLNLPETKCCGAVEPLQRCEKVAQRTETCVEGYLCTPDDDLNSDLSTCKKKDPPQSTQWIGIILSLLSSITVNIGLNLQKLALRKRHEKVIRRKERERIGIFYRLASFRASVSNMYKNFSQTSLTGLDQSNDDKADQVQMYTLENGNTQQNANSPSRAGNDLDGRDNISNEMDINNSNGNRNENNTKISNDNSTIPSDISEPQIAVSNPINPQSPVPGSSLPRLSPEEALERAPAGYSYALTTRSPNTRRTPPTVSNSAMIGASNNGRGQDMSPRGASPAGSPIHNSRATTPNADPTGSRRTSPTGSLTQINDNQKLRLPHSHIIDYDSIQNSTNPSVTFSKHSGETPIRRRPPRNYDADETAKRLSAIISTSDKDKPEFQKNLRFGGLFHNSRWLLGIFVFVFGNICNFAALNFAAQSLLGPLGSLSLVVNVIVAPLLNGEQWSYTDVIGVFLIVCGSVVTVIASNYVPKDYNLCVLLKLFRKLETILFLSITIGFMITIFLSILTIEKNIAYRDVGEAAIEQALRDGELVDVAMHEGDVEKGVTIQDEYLDDEGVPALKRVIRIKTDDVQEKDDDDDESSEASVLEFGKPKMDLMVPEMETSSLSPMPRRNSAISLTFKIHRPEELRYASPIDPVHVEEEVILDEVPESTVVNATTTPTDCKPTPNIPTVSPPSAPSSDTPPSTFKSIMLRIAKRSPFIARIMKIQWIPRFENKIPLDSFAVRVILPFSYASLGGLMGTLTVLFAKATIHLITETMAGQNQFKDFSAFFFTIITLTTAVSQVYWINMGLARYDALLQIPVFYVVWTLFDIIGGGIYYDEFKGYSLKKFILFCFGIMIIFSGVIVLAGRLKKLEEGDEETTLDSNSKV